MALSQHYNVIEAFSANTSDEPFGKGILPRTFRRAEYLFDSHSLTLFRKWLTAVSDYNGSAGKDTEL
jgi:hypothetical protein